MNSAQNNFTHKMIKFESLCVSNFESLFGNNFSHYKNLDTKCSTNLLGENGGLTVFFNTLPVGLSLVILDHEDWPLSEG